MPWYVQYDAAGMVTGAVWSVTPPADAQVEADAPPANPREWRVAGGRLVRRPQAEIDAELALAEAGLMVDARADDESPPEGEAKP